MRGRVLPRISRRTRISTEDREGNEAKTGIFLSSLSRLDAFALNQVSDAPFRHLCELLLNNEVFQQSVFSVKSVVKIPVFLLTAMSKTLRFTP